MFLVEQAFLGREEIRAPLKMPAGLGGRVPLMGTIPGIFNEGRGGLENECWRCEFLGRFGVILKSTGSEVSIYPALGTQARFLYKLCVGRKHMLGKMLKTGNHEKFPTSFV